MYFRIEVLGFAAMAISVIAYLPQIVHLIREHCSAGISIGAYIMWIVSGLMLLVYAIARRDPVFISLQSYNIGAGALILFFSIKYRGQLCEVHGGETLAARLARSKAEKSNSSD